MVFVLLITCIYFRLGDLPSPLMDILIGGIISLSYSNLLLLSLTIVNPFKLNELSYLYQ